MDDGNIIDISKYTFHRDPVGERGRDCFILRDENKVIKEVLFFGVPINKMARRYRASEVRLSYGDKESLTLKRLGFAGGCIRHVKCNGVVYRSYTFGEMSTKSVSNNVITCEHCVEYLSGKCSQSDKVKPIFENSMEEWITGVMDPSNACPYFSTEKLGSCPHCGCPFSERVGKETRKCLSCKETFDEVIIFASKHMSSNMLK